MNGAWGVILFSFVVAIAALFCFEESPVFQNSKQQEKSEEDQSINLHSLHCQLSQLKQMKHITNEGDYVSQDNVTASTLVF